jgi:hypothetical protein
MPEQGSIPSGWPNRWISWRAGRIDDPVKKLRFLRRLTHFGYPAISVPLPAMLLSATMILAAGTAFAPTLPPREAPAGSRPAKVWMVELRGDRETYSNGLQVEVAHAVANVPREGRVAGIVYHTSESQLADFDEVENRRLKLLGKGLLRYVQEERAYHYLIDRFGRVHRIVREEDAAYHAGNSIWADETRAYVRLNHEFLGVSIETQTRPGDELPEIAPAQTYAVRVLTELLRTRYDIPAHNCVTHAQVSVNPGNFRVGWHTDWAGNFPFAAVGLPDNYLRPLPAIAKFGFGYDPVFFAATGAAMWRGVVAAEDELRYRAAREGVSVADLRQRLRQHYREQTRKEKRS